MNRALSRLASLLVVVPATSLAQDAGVAPTVEVLLDNGPSANRIDIVFLGDGYRDVDQAKLTADANTRLSQWLASTPFAAYSGLFNARLIHVVSKDNGADNGSYGTTRDTALGAYYNCYNIDRLLCINSGAVYSQLSQHTPDYDVPIVLVNDPKYGGAGGSIVTVSGASAAGEILRHEVGHMMARLADEYEDAYPGYPACSATNDCTEPNVTIRSVRADVKWVPWIDAATPVPTPEGSGYSSAVGLFEGARYFASGVYRPVESRCLMRALNYPFCSVCSEGLALSFWAEVSPIDSATPASPATVGCDPVTFSVTTPTLATPLSFSWKLDGAAMPQTGPSATLTLVPGSHTVELVVEDKTPLIRRDPMLLAREVKTWSVIAGSCLDAGQPGPDAGLAARDASQPGPDAAQPGLDAGLPGRDAAQPGPDAAQPGRDAAQPGPDAAQPGPDAAQPGRDAAQPGLDAAQPGPDAAQPGLDAAHPGLDAAQPGLDAAQPGLDAAQLGLDAAEPNPDAAVLVADAAVEGPDADVATSDAGAAGPDAGGPPPPVTAGCGCGSSGSPGFLGIVALVGLLRRRRAER